MFRGEKPATQPRSLRSIAESHVDASNMTEGTAPPAPPYSDSAKVSTDTVSQAARPVSSSADKSPFSNMR